MALKVLVIITVFLILQSALEGAEAATCTKMPGEAWIPQNKLYSSLAATSTPNGPLTVDFSGDSRVYATVSRDIQSAPGRYRLRVLQKVDSSDSDFQEKCDTGWQTLPRPFLSSDYEIGTDDKILGWRIQLYDDRSGEPNVPPPLRLELALGSVTGRNNSSASRDLIYNGPSRIICQTILSPAVQVPTNPLTPQFPPVSASAMESLPVRLDEDQSLSSGVYTLRYVRGGPQLLLRAHTGADAPLGRIAVRIAAKPDGAGPFVGGCSIFIPYAPGGGDFALPAAAQVVNNVATLWRIETAVEPPLPGDYPPPVVHVNLRSAEPPPQSAGLSDSEFICQQPSGKRQSTGRGEQPINAFAGSTKLTAEVDDRANAISTSARGKFMQSLLSAIELWRLSCRGCDADNLAVAVIGEQLYMLAPLVAAFRGPSPARWSTPDGHPDFEMLFLYLNWRSGGRGVIEPHFVPVDRTDAAIVRLCATAPTDLPKELQRVQRAVGCVGAGGVRSPPAATARLLVRILPGFTTCGPDKNVIACENLASIVALNSRDYSFVDPKNEVIFGVGTTKVALMHVLLHEVGHWIGLKHIDSWGNIMSTSLSDSRCIDGTDANALIMAAQNAPSGSTKPIAFYNAPPQILNIAPPAPPITPTPEMEALKDKPAHFKTTPAPPNQ